MKIKLVHNTEQYTDKGDFAAMTRTTVLKCARLVSIAGHSCRNAENLLSSADPPTVDNCHIAETMLGWAYSLAPLRIETKFNYQ